jgi:LmbE family N-acetylglucosaminyl deacetylase
MQVTVISPHLDDGALSCGATIASHGRSGAVVTVVTVFAGAAPGAPSPLARRHHVRWGLDDAVAGRRREDLTACRRLGATAVHLEFPDAIYRSTPSGAPRYDDEAQLFVEHLDATDTDLARSVADALGRWTAGRDVVYAPRALGGHVDHLIVRRAVEGGAGGPRMLLYDDMPYALNGAGEEPGARAVPVRVEAADWRRKIHAIRAYRSQQTMLWKDGDWPAALRNHAVATNGGLGERMWERAVS